LRTAQFQTDGRIICRHWADVFFYSVYCFERVGARACVVVTLVVYYRRQIWTRIDLSLPNSRDPAISDVPAGRHWWAGLWPEHAACGLDFTCTQIRLRALVTF